MKQPLWILNSALFALVLLVLVFIYFSRVPIEERENIEPDLSRVSVSKEVSKINIEKIYEYDLFDTYKEEYEPIEEPELVKPIPAPPRPSVVKIPPKEKPKFLDPLKITLKGIIVIGDGSESTVMIEHGHREATYKIGDMIEDAQLIRIFNNKIIFVRSNGQQEVFYLREKDAQNDPTFLNIDDWNGIVKKSAPNKYIVSPTMFEKRVKNLAQFIDLLGLTSAYMKGDSVGCRVGEIAADSLGEKLGFNTGDIILKINGIKATTTSNRLKIYNQIIALGEGENVAVQLQRGRRTYTLSYRLKDFVPPKAKEILAGVTTTSPEQLKEEQKKMLERKYNFAPTAKDIRKHEKYNMLNKGFRPKGR